MKKLNSIDWVSFKEDALYLEDSPITVGINIEEWIEKNNILEYEIETTKYNEKMKYFKFIKYPYISIYLTENVIEEISIFPRVWENDSRCYQGDIFIFNKKLEVPFLSDDIEKYFPNIEIKLKGYWDRFKPHESVDYSITNNMKIEISMSRSPSLVGRICIKSNE